MKGAWKIESNHIVFQTENELLHPNAEELFAVVNSLPSNFSEEYECEDIHSAFPDVRFSTIGSDIRVDLFSDDRGDIFLELYCYRRNKSRQRSSKLLPVTVRLACVRPAASVQSEP